MAVKYTIDSHAVAFPSKVLASNGGKHIYNIQLTEDVDNGWFVGKGAFKDLDLYTEAAPTSFSGKVVAQAANKNYYVEVISTENALFVYQVPMIEEDWTNSFKKESNFYNAGPVKDAVSGAVIVEGDVVRAYELAPGDIIEISETGFSAKPTVGDAVSLKAISGATAMQLGK